MKMNEEQLSLMRNLVSSIKEKSPFYREKYADIDTDGIVDQASFETLPFTDKGDLRDAYPLGIMAVPESEIVRIHSSSGTTGTPVVIPYTRRDVEDWATMFERCYRMAGITREDRIQITPGYGLWTAGIGFQAGAERLGAMAVPMGPGNTEKQLKMMQDLRTTVLCSTSSYALLLAESIERQGLKEHIHLKKGIIGSERWGAKMRRRITEELGIELYDIYGLTEIYGPGIGISCGCGTGMHVWEDFLYFEVIDPVTLRPVPDGEVGELVITTLRKEGAPLIRYRTHDLTRIIPGQCACGNRFSRIDVITGRTDDMIKVKGVNMFPAQFEEVLAAVPGASSEYQIRIEHVDGKDSLTLLFESAEPAERYPEIEAQVAARFKQVVGPAIIARAVPLQELPRSEKNTARVVDMRFR
ncbi:MAG: phenylacetate--CoA ligase [archaeon]|nr:phenylacetate--CoA ligase [archaeon]